MSMQEFEQENLVQPEPERYGTGYTGSSNFQIEQQKIQPGGKLRFGPAMHIVACVLSGIGMGFSIVTIVGSALALAGSVMNINPGFVQTEYLLPGSILALVGSILSLMLFVAIFIVATALLAQQRMRSRGINRFSRLGNRLGNLD